MRDKLHMFEDKHKNPADVLDYDEAASTAVDYDPDTDDVLAVGMPIGKLADARVKQWLAKLDWHTLDRNLKNACMYTWVDFQACPHCGHEFTPRWGKDVHGTFQAFGYCGNCYENLVAIDTVDETTGNEIVQILDFRTGKTGYMRTSNVLDEFK